MAKTKSNIRKIKDALITQKKLAQLTGINEIRLSRALNGEVDFNAEEITLIANTLNIELSYTEPLKH